MRLAVVLLAAATAILASVDAVPTIDNARLTSTEFHPGFAPKKEGKDAKTSGGVKKDISADTLTEEERGLFSWMMFQGSTASKKLEKLESMERYGPPHIKRPLRFERLPDGREKVISEKAYQAKLLFARAAAKDVEEAKRWENVKEKLANKVKIMKEKLAKKKKTSV